MHYFPSPSNHPVYKNGINFRRFITLFSAPLYFPSFTRKGNDHWKDTYILHSSKRQLKDGRCKVFGITGNCQRTILQSVGIIAVSPISNRTNSCYLCKKRLKCFQHSSVDTEGDNSYYYLLVPEHIFVFGEILCFYINRKCV